MQDKQAENRPDLLRHFPVHATPFVGRVNALAEVKQSLLGAECRLLTLLGPGGVGKTRLAVQIAHNLVATPSEADTFADGIFFVRLASMHASKHLLHAIADALDFKFYQELAPQTQLLSYLRTKKFLLVLDNFEQLLSPLAAGETAVPPETQMSGVQFVSELLAAAPQVKLLITSREALNLQEECLYPLHGLQYPPSVARTAEKSPPEWEQYSAVQLFALHARRVQPAFSLTDEMQCVRRICELTEGLPLALELAAAWLKILPCADIARELAQSLDLLTSTFRNVLERHRSMRAVFEQSWQRLTHQEQIVLRRLSLFHGGFSPQAAAAVAEAALLDLAALVDKSLVRLSSNGRYRIHELLRQFAAQKLAETPADQAAARDRHSAYFLQYLHEREAALSHQQQTSRPGGDPARISENVRIAWNHAVAQNNSTEIDRALDSLYYFYRISSRFQEGADMMQPRCAAAGIQSTRHHLIAAYRPPQLLHDIIGQVWSRRENLSKKASPWRANIKTQREIAFSLNVLGNIVDTQGEREEARQLFQESLAVSQASGNQAGAGGSLYNLGWIAIRQGNYRCRPNSFPGKFDPLSGAGNEVGAALRWTAWGSPRFFAVNTKRPHTITKPA
jgi:predicted ATPase